MHPGDEDDIREWLTGRIGAGVRLGLDTCSEMLDRLGNPHSDFPSVHVAGTNGKGSLCAHLSALGSSNGELIGLFTSPHLVRAEERARVDGRPIPEEAFDRLLEEVREACSIEPAIQPTYFETTFLASMLAFSRSGVDRAVIETGLGGRLDSTRLVDADICAITTISMDHAEILGDSLSKIATEKAGIHRPGVPMICLHHEDEGVRRAIEGIAGADAIWFSPESQDAQEVANQMAREIGGRIGWEEIAVDVTWHGRTFSPMSWSGTTFHLSAAHNPESISHDLSRIAGAEHVLLLGMTQKEDLAESTSLFSNADGRIRTIVTEVNGGRRPTVPIVDLADAVSEASGEDPLLIPEPSDAMEVASEIARERGCSVFVSGSVYLVGMVIEEHASREGLDLWDSLVAHPPRDETEG
jgi:folylpolyglutamate synthase/dihydropteroate synthase